MGLSFKNPVRILRTKLHLKDRPPRFRTLVIILWYMRGNVGSCFDYVVRYQGVYATTGSATNYPTHLDYDSFSTVLLGPFSAWLYR